jgi:lipopolysaccharide/colanic/teichoic acid biosynthesis glycosyltransferase
MKKWNRLKEILNPVDVLSVLFAFQCSYFISYFEKGGFFYTDSDIFKLFICILPFWLMILFLVKYTGMPVKRYKVLFFLYLQSAVSISFLLTVICFFLRLSTISRLFPVELSLFGFLFFFLGRVMIHEILKLFGAKGYNHVNIIIFADNYSLPFIENLLSGKDLGYKLVVIFTDSAIIRYKYENEAIILPERYLEILSDLIEVDFIDEVLYLKEKTNSADVREILKTCEDMGVTLRLKYKDTKTSLSSAVRTDIADGVFLSFHNIPNNSFALAIKKTMDINLSMLMIVVLSPLFIALSILIKLTSRGPVINNLEKTGLKGRMIKAHRFRTVYADIDQKTIYMESEMKRNNPESRFEADPRFTKIGKFLFKTGLDHLPGLFNILKGEMSINGQWHPLQNNNTKSKI